MAYRVLKKIWRWSIQLCSGIFWYVRDVYRYRHLISTQRSPQKLLLFPQLWDKASAAHTFDKHYVYMDRWAFKHIQQRLPKEHVDVGSSIRFLSMATTVVPVTFVDIRPIALDFNNFTCKPGSILELPFADNSIDSLSCLHVAEHIGLGRYGDPLDVDGTKKACKELQRVLAPGGRLYFALPVGQSVTYFNAHRVHNPGTILEYFDQLRLEEFAGVDDAGHFHSAMQPADLAESRYACGCFVFTK